MATRSRSAATYANFADPGGLVWRMLRSGDPAARSALLRAGAERMLSPLDRALAPLEKRRLGRARPASKPILLIVGPPRSGTTLLYQTLARHLPVSYFDNWGALFPRSVITATRWRRRRPQRGSGEYRSYYGNSRGFAAPNDAFHVWNRWLGEDRYRVPSELTAEAAEDMRRFFGAWEAALGRPLLNKNNRNSACMRLLAETLENAVFLELERSPVYVAQSLLIARERIQGSAERGWGLGAQPTSARERGCTPEEDVSTQVRDVFETLARERTGVPSERLVRIQYERFCEDPAALVAAVSERFFDIPLPSSARSELGPFRVGNERRLPTASFERLRQGVATWS
ncbi:MAG: sulfotransferase [Proteobacteria bacterium]|nr:sulfotransferase [Pseudomonadota bacterium]